MRSTLRAHAEKVAYGAIIWILSLQVAHATAPATGVLPTPPKVKEDIFTTTTTDLKGADNVITAVPPILIDIIFGLFESVGLIIVFIAGSKVIFARGDAKKVQEGILAIIYTAVGMAVIGGAWMIVRTLLEVNITAT